MLRLELSCAPDYRNLVPFHVEVIETPLEQLMAEALEAYRVYELMTIRRPGDVWQYCWVRPIDVPKGVADRVAHARGEVEPIPHRRWPMDRLPLRVFDSFFYAAWDDTTPDSQCWLDALDSREFQDFGLGLFQRVQATQKRLRKSGDLLIRTELSAMDVQDHYHDLDMERPLELTWPDHVLSTRPLQTAAYYEKLSELLKRPEIASVAASSDKDYRVMRMLCNEQRRRAIQLGRPIGHDLLLHVLCDLYPSFARWKAFVVRWQEGLGYGDLFIDAPENSARLPVLQACEHRRNRILLTAKDQGEMEGHRRTAGDGWVLYEDLRADFDYDKHSEKERLDYLQRFGA